MTSASAALTLSPCVPRPSSFSDILFSTCVFLEKERHNNDDDDTARLSAATTIRGHPFSCSAPYIIKKRATQQRRRQAYQQQQRFGYHLFQEHSRITEGAHTNNSSTFPPNRKLNVPHTAATSAPHTIRSYFGPDEERRRPNFLELLLVSFFFTKGSRPVHEETREAPRLLSFFNSRTASIILETPPIDITNEGGTYYMAGLTPHNKNN